MLSFHNRKTFNNFRSFHLMMLLKFMTFSSLVRMKVSHIHIFHEWMRRVSQRYIMKNVRSTQIFSQSWNFLVLFSHILSAPLQRWDLKRYNYFNCVRNFSSRILWELLYLLWMHLKYTAITSFKKLIW